MPDIPALKACIDFNNVTVNTSYVGCCVDLELDAFGKKLVEVDVGCLHFDP